MSFTEQQRIALQALARRWQGRRFVLIGASALGCHLRMEWRGTFDLDIVIAVEMNEYPAGLDSAPEWEGDPRFEHRWYHRGVSVDVLPAGEHLRANGFISWPKSGFEMSLAGMDLVFDHCTSVSCGSGLAIDVATLPVIVTLKMASFCDRPYVRERDLEDVGHVLAQYLEDDDRRFDDSVFDAGVRFDHVSAFLCGQDVGRLLATAKHTSLVERFLDRVADGKTDFYRWLRFGPLREEDELAERLAAFRLGLKAGG